jgi:hypothetical protein
MSEITEILTEQSNENSLPIQEIELNKTYTHVLSNCGFDCLSEEIIQQIFKDGRAFSHFIEPWLAEKYPLNHVTGCKKYDHTSKSDESILYDQKTFTARGCNIKPSNMIGEGRKFDEEIFKEKASKLIYIIVSNINFPEIKVKFVKGTELLVKYPAGKIPSKHFEEFFN